MKYIFLLLAASFFGLNSPLTSTTILTGKVTDEAGEVLIGATVRILKGAELVHGNITDYNGEYRFMLAPGTYDVEVSYTGYDVKRLTGVVVLAEQINTLHIVLTASAVTISEVVITAYKVPLIEQDKTSGGQTLTSDQIKNLPTRSVNAIEGTTSGTTTTERKDRRAAKSAGPAMAPVGKAPAVDGEISTRGKRAEATDYYLDGVRVSGAPAPMTPPPTTAPPGEYVEIDGVLRRVEVVFDAETYEEKVRLVADDAPADARDEAKRETPGTPAEPSPRAGLLTAGEWNDLHNWSKHWTDLLADGEIEAYQTQYQFYPQHRYAVLLQNEQGFPLADVEVKLLERGGKVLWEARTDNVGRAELWAGLFGLTPDPSGLTPDPSPKERGEGSAIDSLAVGKSDKIRSPAASPLSFGEGSGVRLKGSGVRPESDLRLVAIVDGQKHPFPTAKPFAEGLNQLKIKRECHAPKNVDIVWAVDATGSMGDEIEYLKTELLDVIGRVQGANPDLAVRMGTVFYRDHGDEYLVKSSPLSPDIPQTVDYIRQQYANGGGDYPEAVEVALEEAVFRQPWSEEAVARICFLVLDASPHQDPAVIASLQRSIREAARRGIRIVPVSASGIQKDTEFLLKFFGLATNGSYVFLTDHSGIGGKHIEPTTDEYKIELLNDLLVRLITEYATVETCEGKSTIRFDDPQANNQQQNGPGWQAFFYPNPASHQFTLELPFAVQSVTLYNAEGKAVRHLDQPHEGVNMVVVSDLAEGFYTIRILKDGRMQSGKVMVVR